MWLFIFKFQLIKKMQQSKKVWLKRELLEKLQQKLHLKIHFLTCTRHTQVLMGPGWWLGTAIAEEGSLSQGCPAPHCDPAQLLTVLAWMM